MAAAMEDDPLTTDAAAAAGTDAPAKPALALCRYDAVMEVLQPCGLYADVVGVVIDFCASRARVLVLGGCRSGVEQSVSTLSAYDPNRNRWHDVPALAYPTNGLKLAAGALLDGRYLVVTGGVDNDNELLRTAYYADLDALLGPPALSGAGARAAAPKRSFMRDALIAAAQAAGRSAAAAEAEMAAVPTPGSAVWKPLPALAQCEQLHAHHTGHTFVLLPQRPVPNQPSLTCDVLQLYTPVPYPDTSQLTTAVYAAPGAEPTAAAIDSAALTLGQLRRTTTQPPPLDGESTVVLWERFIVSVGGSTDGILTAASRVWDLHTSTTAAALSVPPLPEPTAYVGACLWDAAADADAAGGKAADVQHSGPQLVVSGGVTMDGRQPHVFALPLRPAAAAAPAGAGAAGASAGAAAAIAACGLDAKAQWTALPALKQPRAMHSLLVLGGAMYAVGGAVEDDAGNVERYLPRRREWVAVAPFANPRHSAVVWCIPDSDV